MGPDRGAELRGYLTSLADNPQSLDALIGAGRAALDLGDIDAALNFFSRADQISPRNSRVKAGIASTLVQLGQAQPALRTFAEAAALGAPEAEIAADRGLAHDMAGDPRRAQQDYVASLRRREDPEVRRRLALSLAISGQRDAALRLIDPQLRSNDRAAWRTQAFILALTGDAAGANRTAQSVMPPASARDMAPFFARLHGLTASQKAMAVHLGRFPSDGQPHTQVAHVDTSPDPGAVALALGRPATAATRPAATTARTNASTRQSASLRQAETRRRDARRRPEPVFDSGDPYGLREPVRTMRREVEGELAPAVGRARAEPGRDSEVAELNTRWTAAPDQAPETRRPSPAANQFQPPVPAVVQSAPPIESNPAPAPIIDAPPLQQPQAAPVTGAAEPPVPTVREIEVPAPTLGSLTSAAFGPSASVATDTATSAPVSSAAAPIAASEPPAAAPSNALADIAALVNALPQEAARAEASPPSAAHTARIRTAEARTPRTRTTPPPPANPARHWVQIATGPDRSLLPREFARLRGLAPEQLSRRTAYTAPLRATNRLLVGPFATAREAQDFVNQLARHDVPAFAWTSAAGQEIDRIQTR
jgi:Flp pilus assembly protein TadD